MISMSVALLQLLHFYVATSEIAEELTLSQVQHVMIYKLRPYMLQHDIQLHVVQQFSAQSSYCHTGL